MMSAQDLDSAIVSSIHLRDKLIEAMRVAGAVESMILMPLIEKVGSIENQLEGLKTSIRIDINSNHN